jgi:hypothetical protein
MLSTTAPHSSARSPSLLTPNVGWERHGDQHPFLFLRRDHRCHRCHLLLLLLPTTTARHLLLLLLLLLFLPSKEEEQFLVVLPRQTLTLTLLLLAIARH